MRQAAVNGHVETCKLLLSRGAELKAKSHHGFTALEMCENGGVSAQNVIEFLRKYAKGLAA